MKMLTAKKNVILYFNIVVSDWLEKFVKAEEAALLIARSEAQEKSKNYFHQLNAF
jgi:hypothetical protein